jgi:small subunit ribosomal protein S20
MPVTKTAKRALRGSLKKQSVNKLALTRLEVAIKKAKTSKLKKDIEKAISLADKTAKVKAIHKNKSARIKSQLAKLIPTKLHTLPKKAK